MGGMKLLKRLFLKEVKIKNLKVLFKIKLLGRNQIIEELAANNFIYYFCVKFVYFFKNIFWWLVNYNYMSLYIKLLLNLGSKLLFFLRLLFYFYVLVVGILKFFVLTFLLVIIILKYIIYLFLLIKITFKVLYNIVWLCLEQISLVKFFILHLIKLIYIFFKIRIREFNNHYGSNTVGERGPSSVSKGLIDFDMSYTYNDTFKMYDLAYDLIEMDISGNNFINVLTAMDDDLGEWIMYHQEIGLEQDNIYLWSYDWVEEDNKLHVREMYLNTPISFEFGMYLRDFYNYKMTDQNLAEEVGYALGVNEWYELDSTTGFDTTTDKFKNYMGLNIEDSIFYNLESNMIFLEILKKLGLFNDIMGIANPATETGYALSLHYNEWYEDASNLFETEDEDDVEGSHNDYFNDYINHIWLQEFDEEGIDNLHKEYSFGKMPNFFYGGRLYELVNFFNFKNNYSLNLRWYLESIKLKLKKFNVLNILNFKVRIFFYKMWLKLKRK